jgi:hypothetical protein
MALTEKMEHTCMQSAATRSRHFTQPAVTDTLHEKLRVVHHCSLGNEKGSVAHEHPDQQGNYIAQSA